MAVKLVSTREAAITNGVKIAVHGAAGAGKTRLCATTGGNAVILSAEGGLLSLRDVDLPVITIANMKDVHEAYLYLHGSEEGQAFDWICIDSASEIAEKVLHAEKQENSDGRRAYGETSDKMMEMLRGFRDLPRNVYMSFKQERVKDDGTGASLMAPMMPGTKLSQQVPYLFDELFAFRVERDQNGELQRWLQTGRDPTHEAKDRSGALDLWERPDLGAIAAKILGTPAVTAVPSNEPKQDNDEDNDDGETELRRAAG